MAVTALRELAVRSASVTLPNTIRYERKFLVSADPGTPAADVVAACGVSEWDSHPEFAWAKASSFNVAPAGSRWHWEVSIGYELPQKEDAGTHPLSRADTWSFSTGQSQVPALYYYDGDGNDDIRPLVNTAGDLFEGVMTDVAELRATITGNRATFSLGLAVSATNMTNADNYLGAAPHTWKCMGIGGSQQREQFQGAEVRFYQVTIELAYRADGWPMQIPNVGYHYIDYEKGRVPCWVRDPESNGRRVRASQPMALDEDGAMMDVGEPPILLTRRMSAAGNFTDMFGAPPF